MYKSDAGCAWRKEQERVAELCAGALAESRRLVVRQAFGTTLAQSLDRACDFLDRMDEVLVGLDPERDGEAFARSAALHRELETVQARVPREYRRLRKAPDARGSELRLVSGGGRPALRLVK